MRFYTNVFVAGDNVYTIGYNNGERFELKAPYHPYLFVNSNKPTKYKTLDGKHVSRVDFEDVKASKDFMENYSGVDGFQIHGSTLFTYQAISDFYKGEINYDVDTISVVSLDIETSTQGGFPNHELADKEVITLSIRKKGKVVVLGTRPYTPKSEDVTYIQCKNEIDLLTKFLLVWNSPKWKPDVVTGWNVEYFDIPYLYRRITNMLGKKEASKLSPWRMVRERQVGGEGSAIVYDLNGISVLDYLALYKKFSYTPQESYKLDHIAEYELGERKLDYSEYETMHEFYMQDFEKFVDYNIHDVVLVDKLEEKLKFIEQVFAITYDAKVNYTDTFTTVRIWDVIITNYLMDRGYVVPHIERAELDERSSVDRELGPIVGAYVKDPQNGLHNWVCSFDLNSLYPHLIMQYNISPDTFVTMRDDITIERMLDRGMGDEIEQELKEMNATMTPNGAIFSKKDVGFLAELMETMYNDRSAWKKRMIEAKKKYEVTPTRELENEIARCNNMQMAKKIQLNSAYGALGNVYFRWYQRNLAEAITMSGQLSIRWMEKHINQYLNKIFKTDNEDYVIACDTDSMYIRLENLVKMSFEDQSDHQKIVKFLDDVCEKKLQPFIDQTFTELADYMLVMKQKMIMKREAIANKGIWTGKKHYILNVYNNEGVAYAQPKLKMQGIEAVRSSTPSICRKNFKKALDVIMNEDEQSMKKFVKDFKREYMTLPFEEIAFPRSVKDLSKWRDSSLIYKKSTPIHVKGSLIYNNLLKERKLENKYQTIRDGDKIKFIYLKTPNPARDSVISCAASIPKEFNIEPYIDYDIQFEKSFLDPIKGILDVIGWSIEERKATLEQFFG
jgi:DNA polymerase elongation subunit (family B)